MVKAFRYIIFYFPVILFLACEKPGNKSVTSQKVAENAGIGLKEAENHKNEKPFEEFFVPEKQTVKNWIEYHRNNGNLDFPNAGFEKDSDKKLEKTSAVTIGNFHSDFNPVYEDFLIYNHTHTLYIDIDSYLWFIPEDSNEPAFSVDQEISLADLTEKKKYQIGFYGPYARIEDAYWEDDHTVILLGIEDEIFPFVSKIDLKNDFQTSYFYKDSLKVKSNYLEDRINSKLMK